MSRVRQAVITGFLVLQFVGVGRAHEVGGTRFTAPIPLAFLFAGAGVTVAVTALWLGVTQRPLLIGQYRRDLSTIRPSLGNQIRVVSRIVFFIGFLGVLVHGLVGRQVAAENVATVLFWPLWIKGLGLIAIIAGSPWRVLSPWEAIYDALTRIEGNEIRILGNYPARFGSWVAVASFIVGVGIIENLTVMPQSPRMTSVLVSLYALGMLLGGVAFGRSWFRYADGFAVLYRLLGRVAPFRFTRTDAGGYEMSLRSPWSGCTDPVTSPALLVFVVAIVYTVSFDGFTSTPEFQSLLFETRGFIGTSGGTGILLYLLGFTGFLASFLGASLVIQRFGNQSVTGWHRTAQLFAPTLIPIAGAYEVAHNYPFVISNAGQLATIVLEFAISYRGDAIAPLAWLTLQGFWVSQVLLIVLGHMIAVIAAHLVAGVRFPTVSMARRAHFPLVVVMVGYTVLSLWIISRPIVT